MNILKTIIIACSLLFFTTTSFANDQPSGSGTVAETMTSGGYVYVRLEENDLWVAARPIPVAVGDKVTYTGGAIMKDFSSRSLDRTFETILFAMKLGTERHFDANAHAAAAASVQPDAAKAAAAVAPQAGEITPLEGGKTIVDIRAEAQQLTDQEVSLRGRVMKVNKNILGKNWITLQDGTGTAPDNKLLTTSSEVVAVGDLVTAKGLIKTDVDLGSGYRYSVIMEETTFSK